MIHGPPVSGSSNELADWLELEVLISESDTAPLQAINQSLEIAEDAEPVELDQENLVSERRLQQAVSAIHERVAAIGDSYPFALDPSGSVLSLCNPISAGGYAYLFCVIVSAGSPDGLLSEEGPWRPDLTRARALFQVCATIATAGHVNGPSFSVGWPRPDSSSFLTKLGQVYGLFGDGRVHERIPPGAPAHVKDDEIDVIAWQHTNNVRPAVGYFLGQAASGANWPEKSLIGRPNVFHGTWFSQPPASQVRVGTIMPFNLPSFADADADDFETQATIEGELRRVALEHGDLLHRHRVAHFLQKGMHLSEAGIGPIEGIDEFASVVDYVVAFRQQLRAAARSV